MNFKNVVLVYLIIINFMGFFSMYIDKEKAKQQKWRIPEKTLFFIALLGGSIGSNLGMKICRHKTKHWYFVIGMPFIFLVQMGVVIYFSVF